MSSRYMEMLQQAKGLLERYRRLAHFLREQVLMGSYLVDPASSHMLVSKIKPCMSKYKLLYCETANGSLNQL